MSEIAGSQGREEHSYLCTPHHMKAVIIPVLANTW